MRLHCWADSPKFPDDPSLGYICGRWRWHRGLHLHPPTGSVWTEGMKGVTWVAWQPTVPHRLERIESQLRGDQ